MSGKPIVWKHCVWFLGGGSVVKIVDGHILSAKAFYCLIELRLRVARKRNGIRCCSFPLKSVIGRRFRVRIKANWSNHYDRVNALLDHFLWMTAASIYAAIRSLTAAAGEVGVRAGLVPR